MRWRLLDALPEADRREVLTTARRRRFVRGQTLFYEGDPGDSLQLIARGHVAVRMSTPRGDIATVVILRAGECVGELALASPAPRSATVVALDRVETFALHADDFAALRERNVEIDRLLIEALAEEVRRLSALLLEALWVPADKRVLRRLVDLADVYRTNDDGAEITMTQEELAYFAGTTRPTVNRVLQRGVADGWLALERGSMRILDLDALTRQVIQGALCATESLDAHLVCVPAHVRSVLRATVPTCDLPG